MAANDNDGYIPPSAVKVIRVINDEGIGSGGPWGIDGANADGSGWTEACESYPTKADALAAIPAFLARLGLPSDTPIKEMP